MSMVNKIRLSTHIKIGLSSAFSACLLVAVMVSPVHSLEPIPEPSPKPGSFGIEATKTQPAPTRGATITTPGNGASFSNSPITVNGICPDTLLVQVYNNGVLAGSVVCSGNSFSLEVSLFSGENELSAIVYDDLDQAGPVSNIVTVNYTNTQFAAFGEQITLTSSFARRSAPAENQLTWPLQLAGGTGPYAFSIDWGDGTPTELKSQAQSGVVSIAHAYMKAGIYQVNVKVTDVNQVSAFLQVIAVSNGKVDPADGAANEDGTPKQLPPQILWAPTAAGIVLLLPAFWLGRRSQLVSLRNKMLKERDSYMEK